MKGQVRNPIVTWLLIYISCGLYGFYWFYTILTELKNYLGKSDEELNPTMDVVISFFCFFYIFAVILKVGKLIQEAQIKAGNPNAQDQGVMFILLSFLMGFGYFKIQDELNKVWEA